MSGMFGWSHELRLLRHGQMSTAGAGGRDAAPRELNAAPVSRRLEAGFSLIELMVVMVLVVGLFGLIGGSLSRSVGAAELRNEVREVIAGMRHTRGQAIVTRSEQLFRVDADALTWQAAGRDPQRMPEGLDITLTTARSELTGENAGGIRFYPDGSSTGGSVLLSVGEREWHVTVGWLTGEISQEPPEGGR
ncbi:MAG: prepilin-type N-terminal cleavage/methylation domain-containing protein [Gammaproteobacteria bacterium]|nr:prepilin-type N-terminal cleavage/methylation domain-containing protein [Gammaproteobacteria bacterium]